MCLFPLAILVALEPQQKPREKTPAIEKSICELRKKICTRTRARTLAHVRCACKKAFETCVRCACVRPIFRVCDVRSQFRTFLDKKGTILALIL